MPLEQSLRARIDSFLEGQEGNPHGLIEEVKAVNMALGEELERLQNEAYSGFNEPIPQDKRRKVESLLNLA